MIQLLKHVRTHHRFQPISTRLVTLGLCLILGLGLSQLLTRTSAMPESLYQPQVNMPFTLQRVTNKVEGTVDVVPPRFELGQQLYLENCATCHIGIPPAVLPNQTWADLIQDTQHYGVQIPSIIEQSRLIVWQYLENFSRSLREQERIPYRLGNSRYFKILHPRVEFNEPVRLSGCVSCHPGAPDFNYRQLTSEWDDSL